MPSEGHRLHGFTVVSRALRLARQLLLPAVLGGASAGDTVTAAAQWILVILTVPSILVAVAQWMVFRYRLDGDELVIDSGVLSRRRRVIPLARIQNIDLEQGFLERVAGVAELRMETASGGGETEASLAVLALDEARSLQADLMRRRAEARAVAAGSAASGFEAAHGAADPTSGADVPAPDGEAAPPVSRAGDELKRSYGLLSRHHSTVPLERVQAVRIEQTLLRRPLGLVALKIETAGAGPKGQGGGDAGAEAFVPIARMDQVGPLLREVFPDARFDGVPLSPVSPLARRRSFLRLAVPVALAAGLLGTFVAPRWIALLLLLGPAWLYARADYRARAWGRAPGHVLVRSGVLTRMSWVVPERKIQTLHLRATPFQRRLGLGSLVIDTAAGGRVARVVDMETTGARLLLARLAAAAESERRAALNPPAP
ncbi:MAG: PH domain-containing protein [Gemmatimonadota bacterium]